jgi:hypothetical protein
MFELVGHNQATSEAIPNELRLVDFPSDPDAPNAIQEGVVPDGHTMNRHGAPKAIAYLHALEVDPHFRLPKGAALDANIWASGLVSPGNITYIYAEKSRSSGCRLKHYTLDHDVRASSHDRDQYAEVRIAGLEVQVT